MSRKGLFLSVHRAARRLELVRVVESHPGWGGPQGRKDRAGKRLRQTRRTQKPEAPTFGSSPDCDPPGPGLLLLQGCE